MFKARPLIWLVGCVFLVSGCAWYPGKDKQTFSIRPVMHVGHGDAGPEAMYRLGRYNQGKANYTEAIAAYRKVLAVNQSHIEAYNGLAVCYSMRGQHELALQHLRQALLLSPKAAHLHNNLGYIHITEGHVGKAAAAFEQALRLDPENRWARGNVAAYYQKMRLDYDFVTLTMAPLESNPAGATRPVTPLPRAVNALSAFAPATVAATAVENLEMQRNTGARLVQIRPDVFEFRMNDGEFDDGDSRPRNTRQDLRTSGIARLDNKTIRIEVSNGSGVSGMARQVSDFLKVNGLSQARLTDRQPFRQLQTELHHRPGSYALAEQISKMMPKQIPMRESHNLRKDIQVRILLGKDAVSEITYFDTGRDTKVTRVVAESLGKVIVAEQAGDNPG